MRDVVIRAGGLGKRYRLGGRPRRGGQRRMSELWGDVVGRFRRAPTACFWALRDVSFEVGRGEVVGIIGRNGAGKSTLLKILSRVAPPTEGSAEIRGTLGSLLEVGTGFHPDLTGRENIVISGLMLGMTRAEIARRFDEIVAFSGVERFVDTPIKRYSSGMQTRLGFAVAAHLQPDVLVVDEVLAVGDAEFQKKCLGKMKEVAGRGRTVLFVSHVMYSVQTLCSRVIWLQDGRVKADSRDVRGTTLQYLRGTGNAGVACDWTRTEAPSGQPPIVLHRMRLLDANGRTVQAPVSGDQELTLVVDVELHDLDPSLTLGYALCAQDGQPVWWSCHNDCAPAHWPRLKLGRNVLQTRLAAHVLNEGPYSLEFLASYHCKTWHYPPGSNGPHIRFEVRGGLSESPFWLERRPGLCAPRIGWHQAGKDNGP